MLSCKVYTVKRFLRNNVLIALSLGKVKTDFKNDKVRK